MVLKTSLFPGSAPGKAPIHLSSWYSIFSAKMSANDGSTIGSSHLEAQRAETFILGTRKKVEPPHLSW